MSSPGRQSDKPDLLAGHPPAVMAGGKRIVQHKREGGDAPAKPEMTPEDEAEFGPAQAESTENAAPEAQKKPPRPDMHNQQVLLSGAVCKGDRDFQAEAIKHHHDKPHSQPCHEKPHQNNPQHYCQHIQQPRRS